MALSRSFPRNPGVTPAPPPKIGIPERTLPSTPWFDPTYDARPPAQQGTPIQNPTYQAPKAPTFDPTTDPTFLAFQRALQANEDTLRANVAKQVASARDAVNQQIPGLDELLRRRKRDLGIGHAQTGTWSSSARLDDENQAEFDTAQAKAGLQSGLAQTESDLQSQLANQLASGQRQLAEQQVGASGRLQQGWAQQVADQKSKYDANVAEQYREWLRRQAASGGRL